MSTLDNILGHRFCMQHPVIPSKLEEDIFWVKTTDVHDELLQDMLRFVSNKVVRVQKCSQEEIEKYREELTGEEHSGLLDGLDRGMLEESQNPSDLNRQGRSKPVVRLFENLMHQAIDEKATDIHLEPGENALLVRMRKDGMLRSSQELPLWVQSALISRIKILAELDIAEKRLPQDGRMGWKADGEEIDIRVSTLPIRHGEKVVLRLLRQLVSLEGLSQIGMSKEMLDTVRYFFHRPQGMFFVTGPTGAGKSSTLYAGLREVIGREINVTTIEDPVEYQLEGANQVQINEKAGLSFSAALRSILRQDPDVILVGEIRDEETAGISVQAAQTGHLVLSTLHTNDSVSALTRLNDLGIKPFMIGSSVLGILAQRLVRKVCSHCCVLEEATAEELRLLPSISGKVPHAVGCKECDGSGYSGRMAVFELLVVNSTLRDLISEGVSESKIRKSANYIKLLDDGILKMNQHLTTPEELIRVLLTEASFHE